VLGGALDDLAADVVRHADYDQVEGFAEHLAEVGVALDMQVVLQWGCCILVVIGWETTCSAPGRVRV
jgi:hypothetical protein